MFEPISNDSKAKQIELLYLLTQKIDEITEFSESELKAISILESDKYLSDLLTFYKNNKKHVKRKHANELLEAFRAVAKTLEEKEQGWLKK